MKGEEVNVTISNIIRNDEFKEKGKKKLMYILKPQERNSF